MDPDVRAVAHPRDEVHGPFARQVPGLEGGNDDAERALGPGSYPGGLEIQRCCLAGREIVEQRPIRPQLDGQEDGFLLAAPEESGDRKRARLGNRQLQMPGPEGLFEMQSVRRAALAADANRLVVDGGRDGDAGVESEEGFETAGLRQGDERAGVGHDRQRSAASSSVSRSSLSSSGASRGSSP